MVIQDTERRSGPDYVAVEIGKQLLATFKPLIYENDDGNGFVLEVRIIGQRLFNRRAAVLPIIDEESSIIRHGEDAQLADVPIIVIRSEINGTADRNRQ